eukprot:CAMPEP_0118834178 /NCGR_PEP_ID=MMETSP1162-20130426/48550_1 /TAXON_ID=33656 /ORGANISM="Phaeocystis Sp, Strain CCMP2710" /LENGTH=87 /DNA_ID=CAMNT_0006765883 /DNA_START=201 /DNA_END=465 /DNA_ORIENTATION=-
MCRPGGLIFREELAWLCALSHAVAFDGSVRTQMHLQWSSGLLPVCQPAGQFIPSHTVAHLSLARAARFTASAWISCTSTPGGVKSAR